MGFTMRVLALTIWRLGGRGTPRHRRVGVGRSGRGHRLQHRTASTAGATSWTRTIEAPWSRAHTTVASVPSSRSSTGRGAPGVRRPPPMNPLRDGPTMHRHAGRPGDSGSRARSARLWATVLPNPSPGSATSSSSGIPASTAATRRSARKAPDLGHDVVVAGVVLHRRRRALHVHEDVAGPGLGHERQHRRVAPSGGDVVDHGGAGLEGGGGHRGVGGVDADGDTPTTDRPTLKPRRPGGG